jgi:hypothetical protein
MSAQDLQKGEHFHILGAFSQSCILDATLNMTVVFKKKLNFSTSNYCHLIIA